MKVILSRKGFDSSAGGYPSPHFIESGRLLSLPIPDDEIDSNIDRTYADLRFDNESSYLDIMKQLGLRSFADTYVHLDPDINFSVLPTRESDWRGIFGQCSSAQSHLGNKGVAIGDLFLFFGWFRDAIRTTNGFKYVSRTDRHIIWGYMQVGKIQGIEVGREYESWKADHPHYCYRNRVKNTGYIASKYLNFSPQLAGYGSFKYDEPLVLTCPGQDKRSVWKLPKFFHPSFGTKMSYHEKLYNISNKAC